MTISPTPVKPPGLGYGLERELGRRGRAPVYLRAGRATVIGADRFHLLPLGSKAIQSDIGLMRVSWVTQ
jgi:hypothetical protein